MGKLYESLEDVRDFIEKQRLFFVATAPAGSEGHLNLSPKGLDGFRVLGPLVAAYVDYPGSGIETVAHVRENGRIVLLFCAFEGAPNIVRIYGRGEVVAPHHPQFTPLLAAFDPKLAARSVIRIQVERIASACGYGVPVYEFKHERQQLVRWAERKGPDGIARYQAQKNRVSIDGLPGLDSSPGAERGDDAAVSGPEPGSADAASYVDRP
ncbi:MAG TPA: pyridoxamine 5'-phosphate oxidase family protein [Polyangiaceae bacterium]|nr:pyridoxamine 5'-phosphate oxidase family protein [Polyangiaceae bacterium]